MVKFVALPRDIVSCSGEDLLVGLKEAVSWAQLSVATSVYNEVKKKKKELLMKGSGEVGRDRFSCDEVIGELLTEQ